MVTSSPAKWNGIYSLPRRAPFSLIAVTLVLGLARPCASQVLLLRGDGTAQTFDGPAVIMDQSVTPIGSPRSQPPQPTRPSPVDAPAVRDAAQAAHLSPALVAAVAWRESNFRSDRTSRAGAKGEMQLMPATARDIGVDPAKPDENLRGGAAYLRRLLDHYHGDLTRTLAAYNAGPGAVDRYSGAPPYKETEAYVDAIMGRLSEIAAGTAR